VDLVELLKRPEGKTLEFKRELSAPEGALKTIIAFANTAGGTLLVGVEDRSGHVRGISEPLDLEERLANLISDQVAPRLMPEIEILPWRRTQVLAVRVYPSPSRPHYLERAGPDGGVYVRVGSTNRRADRELVEELRRFGRGEAFDEQPMPDLDSPGTGQDRARQRHDRLDAARERPRTAARAGEAHSAALRLSARRAGEGDGDRPGAGRSAVRGMGGRVSV
jgi:ATP-dependent DNA helicase RecG